MSNNTQYTRTDKAIQAALMQLVERKPFEKITVQDILDETPVSRATFYKHYHDKYEIVEKLQVDFLEMQKQVVLPLFGQSPDKVIMVTKPHSEHYRQVIRCLLKVHTENVNLTQSLTQQMQAHYLHSATSPFKQIEALIYGSAITAFQVACIDNDASHVDYVQIMMNVLLSFLGLDKDPQTRSFLEERFRQLQE